MRTRSLSIVLLLVTGTLLAGLVVVPTSVKAGTLFVGGAGPGNYTTIQEAIDAASQGDTVYVYSGTYLENVVIDKSIALAGQNRTNTTIDGQDTGNVVTVRASSVTISGFTILNGGSEPFSGSGIDAQVVENLLVQNNLFLNSYYGIRSHQSLDTRILSNTFRGESGHDVHLDEAYGATISNNKFQGSGIDAWYSPDISILENSFGNGLGILLYSADRCRIVNNSLSEVGYFGLRMCTIEGNTISGGSIGINLWFGYVNVIRRNRITDGWIGIHMYGSTDNVITENDIVGNKYGIELGLNEYEYWAQNTDNAIHHNNFIDNGVWWSDQACDSGFGTRWDDGYPSGGNYWSDYTGPDKFSGPNQTEPGNDGIGDEPRVVYECPYFPYEYVTPEHHEDRYPLRSPFRPKLPLPSAPPGLEALPGHREVTLSWNPPAFDGGSPITGYAIYRGPAPREEVLLAEIGNVLNYTDAEVTAGRTYHYRVAARNAYGEGPKSEGVNVTAPNGSIWLPRGVRLPLSEMNVSLNWTDPQPPIPGMVSRLPSQPPGQRSMSWTKTAPTRCTCTRGAEERGSGIRGSSACGLSATKQE
ncbi:MAG: right-handed parallel beta-helix repeat-containing protein [Thermoplasmata archaeon]|nr:right-handed parallel beta-helix repeat-containing protein [Thermoplasmata archaeon]